MEYISTNKCYKCLKEKDLNNFSKNKSKKTGHNSICKECDKEYKKEYKLKHNKTIKESNKNYYLNNKDKDKYKESRKIWAKNNRDSINKSSNEYYKRNKSKVNEFCKNKRKIDNIFNMTNRFRARTNYIFKVNGYKKNTKTENLLGISYKEICVYLENKFTEGMNWSNRDLWHIDHIIPLSSANTEDELIKLCHYTNIQPLWAEDNLKKGNKLWQH